MTEDALERNLQIVGEAAKHLPESITAAHPDIPWLQTRGFWSILSTSTSGSTSTSWRVISRRSPRLCGPTPPTADHPESGLRRPPDGSVHRNSVAYPADTSTRVSRHACSGKSAFGRVQRENHAGMAVMTPMATAIIGKSQMVTMDGSAMVRWPVRGSMIGSSNV